MIFQSSASWARLGGGAGRGWEGRPEAETRGGEGRRREREEGKGGGKEERKKKGVKKKEVKGKSRHRAIPSGA